MKKVIFAAVAWVGLSLVGCGGPIEQGQEEVAQKPAASGAVTQQECIPMTCEELGFQCGRTLNNCGTFINCGGCGDPRAICESNICIGPIDP